MNLPSDISQKIAEISKNLNGNELKQTREKLTQKYKNDTGQSIDLIENKNESILYSISRMPATFSVLYTLLSELVSEGLLENISSVIDAGAGTGSGYFATQMIFEDSDYCSYEKNENMIEIFKELSGRQDIIHQTNLVTENLTQKADLVISSYVLSELAKQDRVKVFKKLLDSSNNYVLIVDTGTPQGYKQLLELSTIARAEGFSVLAPCCNENCPLENDYCQFFSRVERSSLHRISKSGELSYEDEKYFYILLSRNSIKNVNTRVIRRPKILPNEIFLTLCSKDGVQLRKITRKDNIEFKRAKKIKINQLF